MWQNYVEGKLSLPLRRGKPQSFKKLINIPIEKKINMEFGTQFHSFHRIHNLNVKAHSFRVPVEVW